MSAILMRGEHLPYRSNGIIAEIKPLAVLTLALEVDMKHFLSSVSVLHFMLP